MDEPTPNIAEQAPAATQAEAPAPAGGLDIDALLSEFDASIAKARGPGLAESAQPAQPNPEAQDNSAAQPSVDEILKGAEADAARLPADGELTNDLRQKVMALSNSFAAVNAERVLQQQKADFGTIVAKANEAIAEFAHLPKDFAERWLMAESLKNPELTNAFDNAYTSPQALQWANRCVKRAIERLYKEAKAAPDPNATEDRSALVAWMMRGASGVEPAPRPPNFGTMSDHELRTYTKENFGF